MRDELGGNPLEVLRRWVDEAGAAGVPAPGAMTFATADADGVPHARTVLVTEIDDVSLRFHSSLPTTKTRDLAVNPQASAVFHWPALGRQVILQGLAAELHPAVARAAYPTRPRQLRLVAWAYDVLAPTLTAPDYAVEPGAVEREFEAAAASDRDAAMPDSWTTIRLAPARMDFWQAGTETTPPGKTRFVAEGPTWRAFPVLP
ncbi:pyridoxamine 5'-phosphate oxidase family protein [Pseudonocardia sp.]|uniref:pyridoxine/pyridoxamine 5'-phosphate oxidase n=1 Tax=Pseudonocardia sp. TaxID=60912 RepID=UPI0031FCA217